MKMQSLIRVLIAGTLAIGSLAISAQPNRSQPAPGERGFWCDTSSSVPTTMYQNAQGGTEPWIIWKSLYFSRSGWDPSTRCRAVSTRLETYRRNRQLKYITWDWMNNQKVICTALTDGGRCVGLIYTLRRDQYENADREVEHFLAWREGRAGISSLYESTLQRPYIDVRERLGDDEDSTTRAPSAPPTNVQPAPRQPVQDGMREL